MSIFVSILDEGYSLFHTLLEIELEGIAHRDINNLNNRVEVKLRVSCAVNDVRDFQISNVICKLGSLHSYDC